MLECVYVYKDEGHLPAPVFKIYHRVSHYWLGSANTIDDLERVLEGYRKKYKSSKKFDHAIKRLTDYTPSPPYAMREVMKERYDNRMDRLLSRLTEKWDKVSVVKVRMNQFR